MTDAIEDPIPSVPVDGVDTVSDGWPFCLSLFFTSHTLFAQCVTFYVLESSLTLRRTGQPEHS